MTGHAVASVAVAIFVIVATACGTDDDPDVASFPAGTTAAIAADSTENPQDSTDDTGSTRPTELPPSVSYGQAVMVAGLEEECLTRRAGSTTKDSDDTFRVRDFEMECKVTNSDPRLAGTVYYTGNVDRWMSSATEGVQVQWGTIRIENDGGAWETEYLGIYSDTTGDVGAELYVGTGDYEGLYYYQWVVGTFDPPWPTLGVIFPATVALPQSLVPSLTPPDR